MLSNIYIALEELCPTSLRTNKRGFRKPNLQHTPRYIPVISNVLMDVDDMDAFSVPALIRPSNPNERPLAGVSGMVHFTAPTWTCEKRGNMQQLTCSLSSVTYI